MTKQRRLPIVRKDLVLAADQHLAAHFVPEIQRWNFGLDALDEVVQSGRAEEHFVRGGRFVEVVGGVVFVRGRAFWDGVPLAGPRAVEDHGHLRVLEGIYGCPAAAAARVGCRVGGLFDVVWHGWVVVDRVHLVLWQDIVAG
mmetsp:Transcript_3101/g.6605  ORF Transcript_3101/g.6605 Transcript_3101/m.6605 type:complete len:142 (+) Transcript_3101:406-831(+)